MNENFHKSKHKSRWNINQHRASYFSRDRDISAAAVWNTNWLSNFRTDFWLNPFFLVMFLKGFFGFFYFLFLGLLTYFFFLCSRSLKGTTKKSFLLYQYLNRDKQLVLSTGSTFENVLNQKKKLNKKLENSKFHPSTSSKGFISIQTFFLPTFDFSSPYLIDGNRKRREWEKGSRDDAQFWTYFMIFFQLRRCLKRLAFEF